MGIVRKKQEFITLFRSQRDQLEVSEKDKTLKKSCTPTEECNLEFRPIGSQPIRNKKMVNTGGDERFEKFKTSSKFKPVQRNKKSKVKIDKRFKSMLQKVCSFFAFRQSN